MSNAALFYYELMNSRELRGRQCSALAIDVFKLYAKWCQRNAIKPLTQPLFSHELRKLGVRSKRLRYTLDGKCLGPHGVLILSRAEVPLGDQIAVFRSFAESANGVLA